jgi:hypothetical protein
MAANMSDWHTIDEMPPAPMQVEYFFGDLSLEYIMPYRDERRGLGYWDGEVWRQCGTGHDFNDCRDNPEWLPTHWRELPPVPSTAKRLAPEKS